MFTKKFDKYVINGEYITCVVGDTTYTATLSHDDNAHIDDDDVHSVDQSVTGCTDEDHATAMQARQAWYDNRWFYGTISLSAERDGWVKDFGSIGGIEINYPNGDNDYLTEVANDLLSEVVEQFTDKGNGFPYYIPTDTQRDTHD